MFHLEQNLQEQQYPEAREHITFGFTLLHPCRNLYPSTLCTAVPEHGHRPAARGRV